MIGFCIPPWGFQRQTRRWCWAWRATNACRNEPVWQDLANGLTGHFRAHRGNAVTEGVGRKASSGERWDRRPRACLCLSGTSWTWAQRAGAANVGLVYCAFPVSLPNLTWWCDEELASAVGGWLVSDFHDRRVYPLSPSTRFEGLLLILNTESALPPSPSPA